MGKNKYMPYLHVVRWLLVPRYDYTIYTVQSVAHTTTFFFGSLFTKIISKRKIKDVFTEMDLTRPGVIHKAKDVKTCLAYI